RGPFLLWVSLLSKRVSPQLIPIFPAEIGHTAIALVELVGNLKHCEHQPALGRPGDVTAAWFAPDKFTRIHFESRRQPFLVDQIALEDVGLLDPDVLMIGQDRARRKAHERGDEAGLLVKQ